MSIFTKVKNKKVGSNTFDLSHDKKMSLKMGELVPIHVQEIIPGDKISMSTSQMLRMAPMITPVMHKVNVYTHFFFVPNRILWANWEKFITGGEDGLDTTVFPTINILMSNGGDPEVTTNGMILDYMGLPPRINSVPDIFTNVSALPFLAYAKIYNEYYRDQNLQEPLLDTASDGVTNSTDPEFLDYMEICGPPQKRAWQHDYFTSALPWTQKGPEATIPLGSFAPLEFITDPAVGTVVKDRLTGANINLANHPFKTNAGGSPTNNGVTSDYAYDVSLNHQVDLSEATAATINDLRRAFKLQEWLEKNARGGSRYTESILSHFGVRSSDARLQRPEFLGGGTSPMVISEVLQTSSNDSEPTPQGNMAGHGISVGGSNSFSYTSEEHGYIIGIMSIMPKSAYQQGIPKHFLKFDKFDYYWPSFAHLGEQPIQNKEIYFSDDDENDETFGYTPRYAEYKFINSSVHGEFRTSLNFWHMGRIFENRPQLNADFIACDPTTRIFAVETSEQIYAHIHHRIKARRKMPYFGTPTL